MQNWKFNNPNVVILIGGPDGDQSKQYQKYCEKKISISKMTFPHPIVRTYNS